MADAGPTLISLHLTPFRVVCIAHLLHNCAMKAKIQFHDVNQVLPCRKNQSSCCKHKIRQGKFATTGCPPQPVVARLGNWLKVASLYSKRLPEVRAIVKIFEKCEVLATQATASLQTLKLGIQIPYFR